MNKVYTEPKSGGQMQVEVILASVGPDSKPIYTLRLRYPRIIHGEIMTHRVFGRNARSSRAVPFKTMLAELMSTPFIPWHWGKNQSGMQAEFENENPVHSFVRLDINEDGVIGQGYFTREEAWRNSCNWAIEAASSFDNANYHKQNVNRLIEPFSWIDVLVTSTEWDNFLWLRDHEHAEPHLQDLARLVKQALDEAEPQTLALGEWHLPYITKEDLAFACLKYESNEEVFEWARKVSAARCARISYAPFDGNASYEKEIQRYEMLIGSDRVHASPLEHQATPDKKAGQISYGEAYGVPGGTEDIWTAPHLHGNLNGYIQARKLVPGECYNG